MKSTRIRAAEVEYEPASEDDVEHLVALRIEAMRESLERLGRFDPERARARFVIGFEPHATRHIVVAGERVGFVVVKASGEGLLLEHLYVRPQAQGREIGSVVLLEVSAAAGAQRLALQVGALKGSAANRFYARHGFRQVGESDWDVYYRRDP